MTRTDGGAAASERGAEVTDHERPPDLTERVAAATALSQLAHLLVSHCVDGATLAQITEQADGLARRIAGERPRRRRLELGESPRFLEALKSDDLGRAVEDGAFLDLFEDSPVSGSANPLSIGLRVRRDGEEAVGSVTIRAGFEGAPGRAHGGVVAACVDETVGGLLPIIGSMAFTGQLDLTYRAPCPLEVPLEFRARLVRRDGRKLYIHCEGHGPDGIFVVSDSIFISVELDRFVPAATRRAQRSSIE